MTPALLQDFIGLRGGANVGVTQGADSWLDLGGAEDAVLFTDVREATNAPQMNFETSPDRSENSFVRVVAPFTLAAGPVRVDRVLWAYASVPIARYVRWRLTGDPALAWTSTFRIWVATYAYA